MKRFAPMRSLGLIALCLLAAPAHGSDAREGLRQMALADYQAAQAAANAKVKVQAKVKAAAASAAVAVPAPAPAPAAASVQEPSENNVDRFFRTGTLRARAVGQGMTKLCVGPCEGGQLLNLRFSE